MPTPDDQVALELARLSAEYAAQLPQQVQAVENEMTAWLGAPRNPDRFELLSHKVHQLKGSGSTFGCPGVSRAAQTLEQCLDAFRRDMAAGNSPAAAGIESAMARLQNEAARAHQRARSGERGQ